LGEDLGKLRRRERSRIYFDILCSIVGQESETGAKITKVQNEVNLPSDRLRAHLREMSSLGLVDYGESSLASTEKGRAFVDEFKRVVEILRQFGL
jgi:predicted transcriptional regulator